MSLNTGGGRCDLGPSDTSALSDAEIDDVIAFLQTRPTTILNPDSKALEQ